VRTREKWIDAVKAIAILFVLLGHAGVKIPILSDLSVLFYVPVFFVLAGYLHSYRPENHFREYIRKRAMRLLLPYFGCNLFLLLFAWVKEAAAGKVDWNGLLRSCAGFFYGTNTVMAPGMPDAVYEPLLNRWNSPMWFLPALFLAEMILEGMLRIFRGKREYVLWGCVWCAVLGGIVHYFVPVLLPWSLGTVLVLELLLALGLQLKSTQLLEKIAGRPWIIAVLVLAAFFLRSINGTVNISVDIWGKSLVCGVLAVCLASVAVMSVCYLADRRIPEGLLLIGGNTLPVLCLHMFVFMFVQAGIQIVLPGFPEEKGFFCEAAKIGMVFVTIDLLVIGKLWTDYARDKIKSRFQNRFL